MEQPSHPLRVWRDARNMQQTELARLLKVTPSHISQIESGQKGCSLDMAVRIVDLTANEVPLRSLIRAEAAA